MDTTETLTAEILADYARGIFSDMGIPPTEPGPTMAELAATFGSRETAKPDDAAAMDEAAERLLWLIDVDSVMDKAAEIVGKESGVLFRFDGVKPDGLAVSVILEHAIPAPIAFHSGAGRPHMVFAETISVPTIQEIFRGLDESEGEEGPGFPLAPLIRRWAYARMESVQPHYHDRPLLPVSIVGRGDNKDRLPAGKKVDTQLLLPAGFSAESKLRPCLPMEVYGLGRGPESSPGRGAPWPLRVFIYAVMATPENPKKYGRVAPLDMTLRKILTEWLYPQTPDNPNRRPPARAQWERSLHRTIEILDSTRLPIAIDGRDYLRRVVELPTDIPRDIDEPFRIKVHLPPDSHTGPQVSPNLKTWGVNDAVAFRLLISLPYQWARPGVTLFPVPRKGRGKGPVYIYTQNRNAFPRFSKDDLLSMAFPMTSTKNQREMWAITRAAVGRLADSGELIDAGDGLLLPPQLGAGV